MKISRTVQCRGFLLFVLCFLTSTFMFAQTATVTGKVSSDKENEPLQGVTVRVKNSGKATKTNAGGAFLIIALSTDTLVFSIVGFETKEVAIENQASLTVVLTKASQALDAIVVIGYGTVKKSDLTGSVISLKSSDLTPGANVNVQQMLQERAAGVQISQNSGEPGAAMNINDIGSFLHQFKNEYG